MSNYTKTTNFATKDSLPSGNANKIVKGTEIDTEFNNIATAVATKADTAGPTFTGTVTIPTADINGGAVDGTTIGASSASSIIGTTIVANTSISIAGDGATVTGIKDEDDMSSNSATKLATQQSIKAYVDSQVTAQDLDVTDGSSSIDIDLDSESLGILGGTGIDSTASGTGVTLAIDSTVTTLTGSQTLTNKTLTAPTLTGTTVAASLDISGDVDVDGTLETDALSINGTTVTSTAAELNILDGVTSTAAELNILDGVTATTAELNIMDGVTATTAELNIMDGVTSTAAELNILDGKAFLDEDDMSSNSATGIASQQSIKAYVDSQVTAQDLDFQADSGGALSIDLDSETLTFTGGTGIDTSGSGNAVTFAIDSTVATLTGSQTLTNKSLTAPTLTGTAVVASLDISGDIDVDGTTNLDVVDIDGAVDFASTTAHAGNATFADNAKAIFGAGSDLQIYHNANNSYVQDVGTGKLHITSDGTGVSIDKGTSELMATFDTDGAVTLYHNNAAKLATTSTGIDVTGSVTANGGSANNNDDANILTLNASQHARLLVDTSSTSGHRATLALESNGNETTLSTTGSASSLDVASGDLTLDVAGDIHLDADGGDVNFKDGGTTYGFMAKSNNDLLLGNVIADGDVLIRGNDSDGGGNFTALTLDMSDAGSATFNGRATIDPADGDADDQYALFVRNNEATAGRNYGLSVRGGSNSSDESFSVRNHDNSATYFKVRGDGNVGIGTSSPSLASGWSRVVHVDGSAGAHVSFTNSTTGSSNTDGLLVGQFGVNSFFINREAGYQAFYTSNTERMRIDSNGNVGLNSSGRIMSGYDANSKTLTVYDSDGSAQSGYLELAAVANNNGYNAGAIAFINDANSNNSAPENAGSKLVAQIRAETVTSDTNAGDDAGANLVMFTKPEAGGLAERLRIDSSGTLIMSGNGGSTTNSLDIAYNGTSGQASINADSNGGSTFLTLGTSSSGSLNEAMRIDSSGRVGIGGTPNSNWRNDATDRVLTLGTEAALLSDAGVTTELWNNGYVNNSDQFLNISTRGASRYMQYSGAHKWFTAASASAGSNISTELNTTPKMVLDISGNLLVGKSAANNGTVGVEASAAALNATVSGDTVSRLNRLSTDGEILRFQKDTATVGSISTYSSTIQFGQGNVNLRFDNSSDQVIPANLNGSGNDDAVNLGAGGARFNDIFATNGTIQTSDRNEKQDIEELSDAEQRVAVAAKGLLRKFRWKSAVEEKGDDARIHFGIIAQDLQDAFTAEGLDAGRYAMFISSTWTDEETGEERTRLGVRYSELLAFIISAI